MVRPHGDSLQDHPSREVVSETQRKQQVLQTPSVYEEYHTGPSAEILDLLSPALCVERQWTHPERHEEEAILGDGTVPVLSHLAWDTTLIAAPSEQLDQVFTECFLHAQPCSEHWHLQEPLDSVTMCPESHRRGGRDCTPGELSEL